MFSLGSDADVPHIPLDVLFKHTLQDSLVFVIFGERLAETRCQLIHDKWKATHSKRTSLFPLAVTSDETELRPSRPHCVRLAAGLLLCCLPGGCSRTSSLTYCCYWFNAKHVLQCSPECRYSTYPAFNKPLYEWLQTEEMSYISAKMLEWRLLELKNISHEVGWK